MSEVLASYDQIELIKEEGSKLPTYKVHYPEFTPEEKSIVDNPKDFMGDYKSVLARLEIFRTSFEKEDFLDHYIRKHLEGKGISDENFERVVSVIMDQIFFGYGKIGPLMRDDHLEDAILVFKLAVDEFPGFFNPHDSLGEAYFHQGDH